MLLISRAYSNSKVTILNKDKVKDKVEDVKYLIINGILFLQHTMIHSCIGIQTTFAVTLHLKTFVLMSYYTILSVQLIFSKNKMLLILTLCTTKMLYLFIQPNEALTANYGQEITFKHKEKRGKICSPLVNKSIFHPIQES